MTTDALTKQQADAILKALDDAIGQASWDESNFLKVIGKGLREIRDEFAAQLGAETQKQADERTHLDDERVKRGDQQKVYVALYSFDGSNIQTWERIVVNLPRQMISRPIYVNEEDVQNIIKTKENKMNEAYAIVYINQSDILQVSTDKLPLDKLGKPLLVLKDNALKLENMAGFVHQTGTYTYRHGRLIKE